MMAWCIGKAASSVKEFYILPEGNRLFRYDRLAVCVIVKNSQGGISSCDIPFSNDPDVFFRDYEWYTEETARTCKGHDRSHECMVIGTSVITETEIDSAVGMYTGIYNNPFLIWGTYRRKLFRYLLPISFQFHHTQMDGAHAGRFLANLQSEIDHLSSASWGVYT